MSAATFTVPCELPSLNEYIDAERGNRYAASRLKKDWTEAVRACACGLKPVTEYPVRVTCYWWLRNRRKDIDNVRFACKFLLDGLQAAGVLRGDGQQYVAELHDKIGVDAKNPRVEVTIEPC